MLLYVEKRAVQKGAMCDRSVYGSCGDETMSEHVSRKHKWDGKIAIINLVKKRMCLESSN